MTKIEARKIIRTAAEASGFKYRITADGQVHFHGTMPNTNQAGWWLFALSVEEAVERISQ